MFIHFPLQYWEGGIGRVYHPEQSHTDQHFEPKPYEHAEPRYL